MQNKTIIYLEATLAVLVWGCSFVAIKIVLREVSPVVIVWLRFAIGMLVLGAAVFVRKEFALPRGREWGYFALLGFLGITFHQWLQSNGLQTTLATTTAWIVASMPVFIAILGWLVLGERPGWAIVGGIGLATLGVLLVVSKGNIPGLFAGKVGTIGDVLILISAPNWAIFSVLSRSGLKKHPAARMMFYVMGLGWIFTSILFLAGRGYAEIPRLTTQGWLGIGFLGIFCSGLAYIFWYDALRILPASQAGVFLYIEPLVTAVVAAFVLAEPLLWSSVIGGGVILFGVWVVNRPRAAVPKEKPVS